MSSAFKETFFDRFRRRTPRGSVAEGGRQKQPGEIGGNTISRIFFFFLRPKKQQNEMRRGAERTHPSVEIYGFFDESHNWPNLFARSHRLRWPLSFKWAPNLRKYWRICQSNFEFFKKHFSFILQQVLPPKCARRLNSLQVGQRLSGKKIFAGHFGRKNGDAYQLPWQPEDDEMLSFVEN